MVLPDFVTTQLQTQCVRLRTGLLYGAVLAGVGGLLCGIAGAILLSEKVPAVGWPLLVLALPLLLATVPLYRRGQLPFDVALTPAGLQLTPLDRALKLGVPAETLPLGRISGYAQVEQYNSQQLTLYLIDNRTLTLADRPRSILKEPEPGFVPLAELSAALRERLVASGSAARPRPNFFQSVWGRGLAGVCAICFGAGLVLLLLPGVEWTQGLRLLTFSSIYLGAYWRNRRSKAA